LAVAGIDREMAGKVGLVAFGRGLVRERLIEAEVQQELASCQLRSMRPAERHSRKAAQGLLDRVCERGLLLRSLVEGGSEAAPLTSMARYMHACTEVMYTSCTRVASAALACTSGPPAGSSEGPTSLNFATR